MEERPAVTELLIHTADIYRDVQTVQGRGRFLDTPTPLYTGVGVRISSNTGAERLQAEQLKSFISHNAYCEPTQDVKRGDLLYPTDSPWVGQYFRVVGVIDPSIAHHRKLLLELIRQGT